MVTLPSWAVHRIAVRTAICLAIATPIPSGAAELACHAAAISVVGTSSDDLARACEAARAALAFLEPAGLTLEHGPSIRLVDQLPGDGDVHALGRFDARRNVAEMLDHRAAAAASEQKPRAFKIAMSKALWQSYVAHEVAHAVLRAADGADRLSVASHEYVAAVVQLGTLPDDVRSTILRTYADYAAFADASELSDLYYYLAPCAFAVKSYRHYIDPANGPAFISKLIADAVRRR